VDGDSAVRVVRLDRPDKLNAITGAMHRGLAAVWRQLRADRDVRAVVLTGTGRAFSVGGDKDWFAEVAADADYRYEVIEDGRRIINDMAGFACPVIAAVNGPAIGLGCSLAMMSDIVIMDQDAFLADPHAAIGLVAADGGSLTWPLMTSLLRAKEYLFTGDRIDAHTAERFGMANRVVGSGKSVEEALKLAERLAAQPQRALRDTKRALNIHLQRAVAGVIDFAFAAESETLALRDFEAAATPAR
jgi:enoyl-CoA hydratase